MTPERIAKLDKLGFAWDCRKPSASQGHTGGSRGGGGSNCGDTTDDDCTTSETNNVKQVIASTAPSPAANSAVAKSPPTPSRTKMNGAGSSPSAAGLTVESVLRLGGFSGPKLPGEAGVGGSSSSARTSRTMPTLKQSPVTNDVQTANTPNALAVSPVPPSFPSAGVSQDSSVINDKPEVSEVAAATLSRLPCEFFSFSKLKFTKFPKINLTK